MDKSNSIIWNELRTTLFFLKSIWVKQGILKKGGGGGSVRQHVNKISQWEEEF